MHNNTNVSSLQCVDGDDHKYEEFVNDDSLRARWIRFWLAPPRIMFLNTPIRRIHRVIPLTPDSRILDVGCGAGGLLIYLRRKYGIRQALQGVDISPSMVAWAQLEMQRRGIDKQVHIMQASCTQLPFSDATFDAVFSTYVIKQLTDDQLASMLNEVKRVLKPEGIFCFWEAGPTRPALIDRMNRRLIEGETLRINMRNSNEIYGILDQHGFADIKPYGHAPYLYYPIMRRVGFTCRR